MKAVSNHISNYILLLMIQCDLYRQFTNKNVLKGEFCLNVKGKINLNYLNFVCLKYLNLLV